MELVRTVEGSSANRARDGPGVQNLRGNMLVNERREDRCGSCSQLRTPWRGYGESHRSQTTSDGRAGYADRIRRDLRPGQIFAVLTPVWTRSWALLHSCAT